MKTSALSRFLKYVTYDTRSDEHSTTFPSTPGQLVLLEALVAELKALGLDDAAMDEYGYVMATVPPTPGCEACAGHRLYRACGHVAGDAWPRRPADRPRSLRRTRSGAARRSVGDSAPLRQSRARGADRQHDRDRVRAHAARIRRQGGRCRDRGGGRAPSDRIRTFRTVRCASRSRPTRRLAEARTTSTSTRFGAVVRVHARRRGAAASSSSKAFPPTRSRSRSKASIRIPATPRDAWSTPSGLPRISSPAFHATR